MQEYKMLEEDTIQTVERLQSLKVVKNFEVDDIAQIMIRKIEHYQHKTIESLSKSILPILFSLVGEDKLKLKYIAICKSCNIPIKETSNLEIMADDLYCFQCDRSFGYEAPGVDIKEKFYFTSKNI